MNELQTNIPQNMGPFISTRKKDHHQIIHNGQDIYSNKLASIKATTLTVQTLRKISI